MRKETLKKWALRVAYEMPQNGVSHASLTSPAYYLLKATLEGHGNRLSEDHAGALYHLCGTLTQFAQGKLSGRKVFALSTGLGKTSALIAWITALYRLGEQAAEVSVAVSASKVEALCKIKTALLANGIPEAAIGLKHSLASASLPSTGDLDRRFQLVTHARVRGGKSHELFTQHKGKPRSVMIYDESLFRSDAIAIGARDVRGGLGFLTAVSGGRPQLGGVIAYLERCRDLIASAVQHAQEAPQTVKLPDLSELELAGYPDLLQSAARGAAEREMVEPLGELIALAGSSMRVAVTPQGEGLLWHRIAVPEELDRVLVLDASYPIRQLCKLDPTLSPASPFSDAPVKRWDRVTLRQMFAAGGRNTVAASFLQDRREKRAVSREVVEVVKRIPADEAVLVFVFKDAKGRIAENLLLDMREAGIDIDAKVTTPSGPRDRINVATWGSETSSNEYVHCRHVILAGVLHRSLLDLASVAVGQLDDAKAKLDGKWLLELMRSEVGHCVFQAMSRGACREVEDGQAKAMTAYVILPWPLQPLLELVTPGLRHELWEPAFDGISDGVVTRMALAILSHLKGLPEGVRRVPTRQLKEALRIPVEQKMAFSRAVKQLAELSAEWGREGHSLVRADAGFYGFEPETGK